MKFPRKKKGHEPLKDLNMSFNASDNQTTISLMSSQLKKQQQ